MKITKVKNPGQGFKPKNDLVSLEDLDDSGTYAITINPIDKFQFMNKCNRLKSFYDAVLTNFCYTRYKYCYYVELSSKGRLHLHGTVNIKKEDRGRFYLSAVPNMLTKATIVLKNLSEDTKWLEYCMKQCDIMDDLLEGVNCMNPIVPEHTLEEDEIII